MRLTFKGTAGQGGRRAPWRVIDHPYVLLTLANLFWAGNFVVARGVHEHVPPVGLAFWRWSLASLVVLAIAWPHVKRDWPVMRAHAPLMVVFGLLGISVYNVLAYIGLQTTTAINGVLVQSTMPVAVIVMAYALFRDRVVPLQALGVLVSFAGAVVVITKGSLQTLYELSFTIGDIWILCAVLAYGTYTALLRKCPRMHPMSFLFVTFAVGAASLLVPYLWEEFTVRPMPFDWIAAGAIAYVALVPSILSYLFYNRAVPVIGPTRTGAFFHLMPAFGIVLAVIFLDEALLPAHIVGMGLIIAGITLAARRQAPA